ncbi:MAG: DUF1275 domain-containing protein [Lentimicrobium sp.]|jgi:uncharacterized membrane protein YoaK (UPF0700 family)|nr:DUF1275 domain-containing protein [Lentimicrobium sp.]
MFQHQGKRRSHLHNLRLATLLSFVAGIVNVTGVLAVKTLTTNVTGHFAYFAEEITKQDYLAAITFFVLTLFFLFGAFCSNFISESVAFKYPELSHVIPISIEILVLILIGFFGTKSTLHSIEGRWIAFGMLFAMGIQNSLVTKISKSTVRTTHLTGLFTDLGIELSQLFFFKNPDEIEKLNTSIILRLSIITFFFFGCFFGGFAFKYLEIKTLFVGAFFLLVAQWYDYIRLRFHVIRRSGFKRKIKY